MKTFTEAITSCSDIEIFVEKNSIKDSSRLLIQLFSGTTDTATIREFQAFFKSKFPQATLIGSTSDGVINNTNIYPQDKSTIVFSSFETTELVSILIKNSDSNRDNFQLGKTVASTLISENTKLLITFTDGIYTNGEEYIKGIESINNNIIIAGGMAGDNGRLEKTFIFDKNDITSNGVLGVALNSKTLQVTTDYSFDWLPIGKKLQITKAVKNRVYEIDGIPAVNLYAKYLGEELSESLPQIGIEFPLILNRDGVSIGRAVILRHDDGSLTFSGNIAEGEIVRFGVGNVEMIIKYGNYYLDNILQRSQYQPEAFFIYSCMARRRFIGSHIEKEIQPFSNIAPTAGFFTYGEFYHADSKNQLLNETMTVLALSESSVETYFDKKNEVVDNKSFDTNPLHAISHLANYVSNELEDLNNTLESRIEESTEYIYKQAYLEKLTQLPNRSKLLKELPSHFGKMLFLLNIDNFTLVNDFYGHSVGDLVLKNIASVLNEYAREEEATVFKLPSDEYAFILEKTYTTKELEDVIEKLLLSIKNTSINVNEYIINVDVTMGAAMITKDESGLINADMTLKLAKSSNKNYLIFDESLMLVKHYETNLKMASKLRNAIQTDNIIPYFQPIYCTKTGAIKKYEALVRLRDDDGTMLSPFTFLEIAQKIKLYPEITKIMIEKTFSFFKKNGFSFTINLSFEDILNRDTRDFIFKKIEEYGIAKQLTFEILETQQMEDEVLVQEFIKTVYKYGADIAIDDFGSGFANFIHMTKMKAEYIKIDGSLIKNIDTDKNSLLVVETIIIFAQKLNMKTVAEFVHSKEIFDIVCGLNIDYAQGYYLSEPLPLEQVR
ncbi:EAL domain-containing protein [Sulfurimonas sp.]|uniref:EAL domain-containing protein n=1 Tax=Sulfurimonas sp. TaxID=2022749 RepID=UPI0035692AFC